ncbi:endonuclease [Bacteroidales bacterium]|nr:endonuclease [Bacteroidales bacterium]
MCISCSSEKQELKVLQFNIWQEGTMIPKGFDLLIDELISLDAEIVTFSEIRNYNDRRFIPYLLDELAKKGITYYGQDSDTDVGVISKYPIVRQATIYPLRNDRGSVLKTVVKLKDREIAVYSAHLDWLNCSLYLPRGYDGSTWKKLEQAVVDIDLILADNRSSFRDDAVEAILEDAKKEQLLGSLILIGGDFNEPSHLDWQADTKDIRDHQGLIINWDCSIILYENGFEDAFRVQYPDAVDYPGFTFPANNTEADIKKLAWSPEADDRERIDFIYYYPQKEIQLKDMKVVGPEGSILYGKRTIKDADSKDEFILPLSIWPTDHKAVMATFELSF